MLTGDQLAVAIASAPVLLLALLWAAGDLVRLWAQQRPAARPRGTARRALGDLLGALLLSAAWGFLGLSTLCDALGKRAAGQRYGGGR
ncbi:hypothetical protein [Methylobacterium nodulans]|uniref:Uncharacterized protein n=1 Tax=Methylobacterium nodulans (strain LMG 21967 / CNCM I-2342 / ORS 2060) TaxID=460265 RepID=B8IHQ6_METNO|nr:hypothetical protein [Methylobacterium nodulans]ACL61719.1 hypothetical protein Mnod_6977 [Methylobacterium nodulans ORS 2060]